MIAAVFIAALITIATIFMFSVVGAIPTYFLWNWLCPALFSLPFITFWQALGLNMLAGILFKSGGSARTNTSKDKD